ncbi:hypothetical protein ACWGDE_11975 [Streptomyces sp. NPDC054956]
MRRGLLVGLVVLGGGLLTACAYPPGPPVYDLAGVYKEDSGRLMVELGRCSNEGDIEGLILQGLPMDGLVERRTGHVPGDTRPGPFPLLAPAPDPREEPATPPSLDPGGFYVLAFDVLKDDRRVLYASATSFKTQDIEALRPGQVWADGKAMSRERFRAYIRDAC